MVRCAGSLALQSIGGWKSRPDWPRSLMDTVGCCWIHCPEIRVLLRPLRWEILPIWGNCGCSGVWLEFPRLGGRHWPVLPCPPRCPGTIGPLSTQNCGPGSSSRPDIGRHTEIDFDAWTEVLHTFYIWNRNSDLKTDSCPYVVVQDSSDGHKKSRPNTVFAQCLLSEFCRWWFFIEIGKINLNLASLSLQGWQTY